MITGYDFLSEYKIKKSADVNKLNNTTLNHLNTKAIILNTIFAFNKPKEKWTINRKVNPIDYTKIGIRYERNENVGLKGIHKNFSENFIANQLELLDDLNLFPSDITPLPSGSTYIELPLILKTPLFSNDDIPFYLIDNPMKKDKVFGIPYFSSSSWKGNLRWVMNKIFLEDSLKEEEDRLKEEYVNNRLKLIRLFGTEKGTKDNTSLAQYNDKIHDKIHRSNYSEQPKSQFNTEKTMLKGMLFFYPTFWDSIELDIINPHDRETSTGKNPIYYEVVPPNSQGEFRLLYVPHHHLSKGKQEIRDLVIDDLSMVVKGITQLMTIYGFSAKRTLGYGIAEARWEKKKGKIKINGVCENIGSFEDLKQYLRQLKEG